MEIKISAQKLLKFLWIAAVALSGIGVLLVLVGFVMALGVDDGARTGEAFTPLYFIATAVALATVPWCLATAVGRMFEVMAVLEHAGTSESDESSDSVVGEQED